MMHGVVCRLLDLRSVRLLDLRCVNPVQKKGMESEAD